MKGSVLLALVFIVITLLIGFYFLKQVSVNNVQVGEQARRLEETDLGLSEFFVKAVVSDSNTIHVDLNDSTGLTVGKLYVLRKDNSFYLISRVDLPKAEEKIQYLGWIGKGEGKDLSPLGLFEKRQDFPYVLEFATEGEFPEYSYFVVTKENLDDSHPEVKVLEARF